MRGARPLLIVCLLVFIALGVSFWYTRANDKTSKKPVETQQNLQPRFKSRIADAQENQRAPAAQIKAQAKETAVVMITKGGGSVQLEPESQNTASYNAMDAYRGAVLSQEIMIGETGYKVFQGRAFPKGEYDPSVGPALFDHLSYAVVPSQDLSIVGQDWMDLPIKDGSKPVLVHATSGLPVLVTGTLIVKFKNGADIAKLARALDLNVLMMEPAIHTAYLSPKSGGDVLPAFAQLSQRPDLEHVDLELISSQVESK